MLRRDGLDAIAETMGATAADGRIPGAVWAVATLDEAHIGVTGAAAFGGTPMRRDSIFRITSMTKPVIGAAVMMLVEDGVLSLDEPVDRLLPELANRRVLIAVDAPLDSTLPAERPILVRDLLNFTCGFGLQFNDAAPIQRRIEALELRDARPAPKIRWSPDEWLARLGSLPWIHQPGETWMYNTAAIILGALIGRAAGVGATEFLERRLFRPLGMVDTAFFCPPEKRDRLTAVYDFDFVGARSVEQPESLGQWTVPPTFPSGAGGLLSTIDDYLSFALMLLRGGTHRGERLLAESSVRAMTSNQLTPTQWSSRSLSPDFLDGAGWGYCMRVRTAPDTLRPAAGCYGWDGGYGTAWGNDPHLGVAGILLTQSAGYGIMSEDYREFWTAVYRATG